MTALYKVAVMLALTLIASCGGREEVREPLQEAKAKEALRDVNRALVERDRELISAYIQRHGLQGMEEDGAGLFYLIWGKGMDGKPTAGDIVVLEYTLSLLDGTVCYTSDSTGYKEFVLGYGGVESGLELGVALMQRGQRAKFILPPHLGHGLLGDNEMIPPRSIIVYDVHLVNIIDK